MKVKYCTIVRSSILPYTVRNKLIPEALTNTIFLLVPQALVLFALKRHLMSLRWSIKRINMVTKNVLINVCWFLSMQSKPIDNGVLTSKAVLLYIPFVPISINFIPK